jgi:hypothetical protein
MAKAEKPEKPPKRKRPEKLSADAHGRVPTTEITPYLSKREQRQFQQQRILPASWRGVLSDKRLKKLQKVKPHG